MTVWIYVLDDDARFLNLIDIIFQKDGVPPYKLFDNPYEMVAQVNTEVGVIVIDDNLGDLRGITIVRQIHERFRDNPLYKPYFIILSNSRDGEVVQEYTNAGIFKYFMKVDPHHRITNAVKEAHELAVKKAETRILVERIQSELD